MTKIQMKLYASEDGSKFIAVRLKGKPETRDLIAASELNSTATYSRLANRGFPLVTPKTISELKRRAERTLLSAPKGTVVTRIGAFGKRFVRPDGAFPPFTGANRQIPFFESAKQQELLSSYRSKGTLEGWQSGVQLAKGNSRLIFALALHPVGPINAVLGPIPCTFIMSGPAGSGKSALNSAASAFHGWGADHHSQYGFGVSLSTTPAALEQVCISRNHASLLLDETNLLSGVDLGKAFDLLVDIGFRIESGSERRRFTDPDSPAKWSMGAIFTMSAVSALETIQGFSGREDFWIIAARVERR